MVGLVVRRLLATGGLAAKRAQKARKLCEAIDRTPFGWGTAAPDGRSSMNVTVRLPAPELETRFVDDARQAGQVGLWGHRSVRGVRASTPLAAFMAEFKRTHGRRLVLVQAATIAAAGVLVRR